jgi:NADH-quinone oxidoreductase subunit N
MNGDILQDLVVVLPMTVLFFISLIPIMIKVARGNREPSPGITLIYSFIGLVAAFGLTAAMIGTQRSAFSQAIVFDGVSAWSSCLVYLISAVGLMLSFDHVATRGKQFAEFCFLLISSAIGMVILIMSNDLIVTFIGIEMMSLCLYILVAMSKEDTLSKEAAFKYFVLGSFASAVFLYGIALIYGTAHTTYFTSNVPNVPGITEQIKTLITTNRIFTAGLGMVIVGFAFKVALFPFHAWAPDVYQGAPTPVTAFMATAVKAATFVAFLRLFHSEGLIQSQNLMTVLTWIAVLTMLIGNVAAIMQNNFKRVLAYSSVAHSGYAMVGLIAAGFGNDFNTGASSLLFYLFSYAFMTMGSFALVALFERNENTVLNVSDLKGLARKYPILALSLTVLMLSLAGIPPTLGFFGKFYVFSAAIEQDMYWLAFWGVINSVISVVYYLRPVVMMYMSEEEGSEIMTTHLMTRLTVIGSAVVIVALGIYSSKAISAVQSVISHL